jgi:hypothetical protein
MKKIALFLMVMVSLVVIVGCNNNKKTVTRFTPEGEVETATPETTVQLKDDGTAKTELTPIELNTDTAKKDVVKETNPATDVQFEVTSLAKNITQSKKGYHLIEGTTPANTAKILVNDYPLSKYKAGETSWSYIAAVSLGNLKKGDNKFVVKAVDVDDKELGSKTFTITYLGVESAKLAATGMDSFSLASLITLLVMGFLGLRGLARKTA